MSGTPVQRQADWPVQAADAVERVVGAVRDKTVVPLRTIARAIVYGLLVAVMGLAVIVLLTAAAVRLVDSYLPNGVWAAYLVIGIPFTAAGLICLGLARRRPR
jgi:hypothetical protein